MNGIFRKMCCKSATPSFAVLCFFAVSIPFFQLIFFLLRLPRLFRFQLAARAAVLQPEQKCFGLRMCCQFAMAMTFFVFLGTGLGGTSAYAAGLVQRVAFYPLEGFFEYDEQGKESGYGVEVLNKITQFSNTHFQFVKADTWEDCGRMLRSGEVDLVMPVTMPVGRELKQAYSQSGIIDTYYILATLKARDDLSYEDYGAISRIKIAVSSGLYKTDALHNYISTYGIPTQNLVFCNEYNECLDKMRKGEVDAIISNVLDFNPESMKILERFHTVSNHICSRLNDPIIYRINESLSKIRLENPTFFAELYKKYFPHLAATPLAAAEEKYIHSLGSIRFSFTDGQGYISRKDGDIFVGILPAIARRVCEKLGVGYVAVDVPPTKNQITILEDLGVKAVPGCTYDYAWASRMGAMLSNPYFTMDYVQVGRRDADMQYATCSVAAIKGFYYVDSYVLKRFRADQIVWCNNYQDCLDAVVQGKADVTFINNYVAEYFLSMYQYSELTQHITNYNHQICFGVYDDPEGLLASAISKALATITAQELTELLIEQTAMHPEHDYFRAVIYQNPVTAIGITLTVVGMLAGLLFLLVVSRLMKRKNNQLMQATAAKTEFFTRMSHDIRTPINGIMGMTALAKDNKNPSDTENCLDKIETSCTFLLGLLNDTLDMAKVESGKIELHLEPYPIAEFDAYLDSIIVPMCLQKGIEFQKEIGNMQRKIPLVDKLRINQIYFNLLSNAVKFSAEGGSVSLKVRAELLPKKCMRTYAEIVDHGIGMSKDFQSRMFDSFTQEEQTLLPQRQGSGLGLSIVKALVELMGGEITVKSELGKGTVVSFYLESEYLEEQEAAACHAAAVEKNLALLSGKHVLLVEDHPLNQEIAARLLKKVGIIVQTADNGDLAVKAFLESAPHYYNAILMDIRMPVMDGFEAAKAIRAAKRPDARSVPIIALTANAYTEDTIKAQAAGMNAHLPKPVSPQKLYQTLIDYTGKA